MGATLALAAFGLWAFSPWATASGVVVVGRLALMALALLSAGGGVYIARTLRFPAAVRRVWLFFLLGHLAVVAAESLRLLYSRAGAAPTSPSPADGFYLLMYLLVFGGLLALPFAPLKREQRLMLAVDITIVLLVGAILLWQVFGPVLVQQRAAFISLAYPLADFLIVAGVVALVQQDAALIEKRVRLALAGGLVLAVLANGVSALTQAFGWPLAPAALNLAGLAARWALLVAVVWQINQRQFEAEPSAMVSPRLRTNLIYGGVVVVIVLALLALVDVARTDIVLAGTLLAARTLTLLVLLRQYFVLRENRRLAKALEQLAVTDGLTGLANRRLLDETLAREIIRAQRYQRPLSLLMLDVNNFKLVNDRRGHAAGDEVLRTLASLIRAQLRASDFAARYGGDEFVVILPESDAVMARNVAEKLDAAIEGVLGLNNGPLVSIGRAAFQPKMTAATLLELADQDMYRAKAAQTVAPGRPALSAAVATAASAARPQP